MTTDESFACGKFGPGGGGAEDCYVVRGIDCVQVDSGLEKVVQPRSMQRTGAKQDMGR